MANISCRTIRCFGDINYLRNVVHYYGYEPGTPDSIQKDEDKRQRFSLDRY